MADVFISYSRADQALVAQLAAKIEAEGFDVWWDADLPPHKSYADVITEKVAGSRAAIVVWSHTAAASEWVRAEADMARNQKKLIQTAIDDVMPPLPFNQIQFAVLNGWQGEDDHPGWRKVKVSLTELCGPRAAKPGVPPPPPVRYSPPPVALPPTPTGSRAPLWIGAGLAMVLLAGVGAWLWQNQGSAPEATVGSVSLSPAAQDSTFTLGATVSDPDGYTNIRASRSTDAAIVGRIAVGERFRTFRQPGQWWQVQLDDGTLGYVARSRIVLDGEPIPQAAAAQVPVAAPEPAAAARFDMTFPDSSTRRLTEAEVYPLGPATLRYARNEIYARKGRRFADPELAAYFSQFSWYRPVTDEVALNPVETANVAMLKQAEARYGQ